MINEKIVVNYLHKAIYKNEPENVVGATKSITLRTLDTISDHTAYVRKYGTEYLIKQVTDITDPVVVTVTYRFYALDGTLLGSRTGGGAFVAGSTLSTAQQCYLEIETVGVNYSVISNINILTDVDSNPIFPHSNILPLNEVIQSGDILRLYLSDTQSTYYDEALKYGGGRGIPSLNDPRLPYTDISTAYSALNSANDGIIILDSEIYDEIFIFNRATTVVQSALGQTPTPMSGTGSRATRTVLTLWNSSTAVFFNESGDDGNIGTWHEPYLTMTAALAGRGSKQVVYGGINAASGIITDSISVTSPVTIEADHGYTPELTGSGTIIAFNSNDIRLHGFTVNGAGNIGLDTTPQTLVSTSRINDNTFHSCSIGLKAGAGPVAVEVFRNVCFNNQVGIQAAINTGLTFDKNVLYNNTSYGFEDLGGASSIVVANNLIYNNGTGLKKVGTGGTFTNNTIVFNTIYGVHVTSSSMSLGNSIVYGNGTFDLIADSGGAGTANYTIYGTNSAWTIAGTSINEDPKLCQTFTPYKFGISSDSPGYRSDSSSDDMGAHFRMIEIDESDIILNGLTIDGQGQYNNGIYILDTANHTGNINKWCTIENFQGIGADLYDDDTDTDCQFLNCIIRNNGNGIKFSRGGNSVQNSLIYRNSIHGIHSNRIGQTFNHNVFFGNRYGLYLDINSSGVTVTNCITSQNSLFGIYSELSISVSNCCITDATFNVDLTGSTNVTNNPLFVNTDTGDEDFNLKTIENGSVLDSPCKGTGENDTDMGAYEVDRDIENDYWRSQQLEFNPRNIEFQHNAMGVSKFRDILGSLDLYMQDDKRVFVWKYSKTQFSNEVLRKRLEYFTTLIKGRTNSLTDDMIKFRISYLPDQKLLTGTDGTIDSDEKTLTDTSLDLIEDEFKGFWLSVEFTNGTGLVVSDSGTATDSGASWTIDEHIGRTLFYNNQFYYVLSNTATVLTLSDPESSLVDGTVDYAIEKYFRILRNTKNQFCVEDEDDELISGDYDYNINFIECVIGKPRFKYNQPRFYYQQETWKTGMIIEWEES